MSAFVILSINHQIANASVREKLAFAPKTLVQELQKLNTLDEVKACAILSTCNRVEIYAAVQTNQARELLSNYLAKTHQVPLDEIQPYLHYFEGDAAIEHICLVATGLNSLVLGEPQIFGQLKEAYRTAKQAKTLNKPLEKLFQHAFSIAKKVRTETKIGQSPVSVAYCAVKLSEKIFTHLSAQTVLLIGAGEMIELCAQHLSQKGVSNIIVANRTLENAQKIAQPYNATALSLKRFSSVIHQADIIISSTAASVPIIGKGLIETALKKRKYKPIFILDIAIPRDIEPEVAQLDEVFLYTIDDLQQVVDDNINTRQKERKQALEIIRQQNQKFHQYLVTLPHEKTVQNYHEQADKIKDLSVKNALKQLKNGKDSAAVVTQLADQLTNKLLHAPFQNIKQASTQQLKICEGCIPNQKPKS